MIETVMDNQMEDPGRRDRAYWEHPYGDAGDAVDFACDHCGQAEAHAFLEDWRSGLAEEWPDYMRWLMVQQDGAKESAIKASSETPKGDTQ